MLLKIPKAYSAGVPDSRCFPLWSPYNLFCFLLVYAVLEVSNVLMSIYIDIFDIENSSCLISL